MPALYAVPDQRGMAAQHIRGAAGTTAGMGKDIDPYQTEKTVGGAISAGIGGLAAGAGVMSALSLTNPAIAAGTTVAALAAYALG